ncbi:MAG: hypothetical protein WAZ18_04470 [Alphaproteobacteria bacterium]
MDVLQNRRFRVYDPGCVENRYDSTLSPILAAVAHSLGVAVETDIMASELDATEALVANYATHNSQGLILSHLAKARTYADAHMSDDLEQHAAFLRWAYVDANHPYLNPGNALSRLNGPTAHGRLVLGGIAPAHVWPGYHPNPLTELNAWDIQPKPCTMVQGLDTLIAVPDPSITAFLEAYMALKNPMPRYRTFTVAEWIADMKHTYPNHIIRERACTRLLEHDLAYCDTVVTLQSALGVQALARGKRVVGTPNLCPLGNAHIHKGLYGFYNPRHQANALAQVLSVQAPLTELSQPHKALAMLMEQEGKARHIALGGQTHSVLRSGGRAA